MGSSEPLVARRRWLTAAVSSALTACAGVPVLESNGPVSPFKAGNRLGWGVNRTQLAQIEALGWQGYVEQQLLARPSAPLPPLAQAQIDALAIVARPMVDLALEADTLRRTQDKLATEAERVAAGQAYQASLNATVAQALHRRLLRALYADQQLLEHLCAFWFNHFNVHQYKADLRVLLPDYEERALRPHALGSFRAMLGAVVRHPAMLRYLDNDQNAAPRVNENFARELLELHTLGVDGGYQQRDVQELARVLTGFGVRLLRDSPNMPAKFNGLYQRDGLFEFNPLRHDFGDKLLLGHTIRGRGAAELDEALDLLAAHPSTARRLSRKLAVFFLADQPSPALVDRMVRAFHTSAGDVAATLRPLLMSDEFKAAEPGKFKDPQHYLLSTLRLVFEDRMVVNTQPLLGWLRRLGQGTYDRQTPDGYPDRAEDWNSAGQMGARFEIARQIASGAPALFGTKPVNPGSTPTAAAAPIDPVRLGGLLSPSLGDPSRAALARAGSSQVWLTLLLSSPEIMVR